MRKRLLLISILLMIPLVLSACGGFDTDEFEEAYTKAIEENDVDDLNELICADEQVEATSEDAGDITVNEFDCEVEDDTITCEYDYELGDAGSQSGTFTASIDGDGNACDFAVEPDDIE